MKIVISLSLSKVQLPTSTVRGYNVPLGDNGDGYFFFPGSSTAVVFRQAMVTPGSLLVAVTVSVLYSGASSMVLTMLEMATKLLLLFLLQK